jgi:hypothetical protein
MVVHYALRSLQMVRVWIIFIELYLFLCIDCVLLTPDRDHESKHLLNHPSISPLNLDFFCLVESLVVAVG